MLDPDACDPDAWKSAERETVNRLEKKAVDRTPQAWLRGLVLLALAIALSGCASVEHRDTRIRSSNDGAVIIRVLPNVQSSSQYFRNWHALKLARAPRAGETAEVEYQVRPAIYAASRTAIYAATLPPGRYRFVEFSAQSCGYMCISSMLSVSTKFSQFEVKPGQITDLGVLVQTDPQDGSRGVALTHEQRGNNELTLEIVREVFPDLSPMMSSPRLSWSMGSVPTPMAALHKAAIRDSYGFVAPRETEGGAFLFGTANGVVGLWKPGNARQGFDIGERVSVDSVLVLPDSRWMAAGEFSVVKISHDRGKTWQTVRGNLPLGLVVDLNLWRDNVVLTMSQGGVVKIYRAPVAGDQWQLVASHATDVNWFFDVQGVRPQSILLGDVLVTTIPGRQLSVLDLNSGRAELRKLPGAVQMFSASADGVLRCRCLSVIAVNPYESNDLGKTWVESTASRFMLMPAFRDARNGVAFKGGFMSPSKFTYTSDGGKTWVETTEAPLYFHELFYSRDGKKAFATTLRGDLWQTEDDGRNWRAIR